ncbi:MAG: DNA polymerase Y family protein [Rhodoferax sp.]|nr:DNA polymerase Y family protein [Rhodoferax sp.]
MHWIAMQPRPEATLAPVESPGSLSQDTNALVDALGALAWWALRFTPKVAQVDDALVLEVSGSERLFGGRQPLLHAMLGSDKPVADIRYARGATSLIALARLQLATEAPPTEARQVVAGGAAPGPRAVAPDDLPLHTLAAARAHLPTLARIGCARWGQLRALPRGGVARRFGAPLLDALDCAYGLKPELYPWLVLPEVFDASLELAAQVEAAPALLFAARRLLNQLLVWLRARQRGVLALRLGWQMDKRRDTASEGELLLRTAEPTLDMNHLQRLLGEHLARITLPAPVLYLRLRTLETQALSGSTASLLPDEVLGGDSWHQLLERLAARLGPQSVLQAQACADHRPERMQAWAPASSAPVRAVNPSARVGAGAIEPARSDGLYPTWLLAAPLKLAVRQERPLYQGPLTLLAGPQRLEAAWWEQAAGAAQPAGEGCALRDYFLARSEQAGLLWIYRERLGGLDVEAAPNWYLHGLFA